MTAMTTRQPQFPSNYLGVFTFDQVHGGVIADNADRHPPPEVDVKAGLSVSSVIAAYEPIVAPLY
jgi:hypothetical protein